MLALTAATSGCGNLVGDLPPPAGITGVRLDVSGDLEVVAYVCAPDVDTLTVFADREGLREDEENPLVGSWSHDGALDGLVTFDLAEPGPGWTPRDGVVLDDQDGYLVSLSSDERETSALWLAPGWTAGLRPGVVVTSEDLLSADPSDRQAISTEELAEQARRACAADS